MSRSYPLLLALLLSNVVHAKTEITQIETKAGLFVIETVLEDDSPIYGQQTYMVDGVLLGKTMLMGVTAELIGGDETSAYVLVTGATGGSSCAEVLSVVKITGGDGKFSKALNACGGVLSTSSKDGITSIEVLERDENTKTTYQVIDSKVIENGEVQSNSFSFLD
ncbi:hypothetical protein L5M43_14390 [Shewanella sp. SW36]|uniref:hypothetical protein n=1 Tax=unclassified Shewanella TaxID=196818 RepID=UPI0021DA4712|nr:MULTISPECIES: hypothetical protein [unclassified Shewanella]MCU7976427.1 hypothetical protein [Shewanella sp. SW36]MCU7991667.1 hypothetical protein [Shewanella sp. SW1]MCU8053047.1 hypothetical protein [Shewanella sp. SM43]